MIILHVGYEEEDLEHFSWDTVSKQYGKQKVDLKTG